MVTKLEIITLPELGSAKLATLPRATTALARWGHWACVVHDSLIVRHGVPDWKITVAVLLLLERSKKAKRSANELNHTGVTRYQIEFVATTFQTNLI